MSAAAKLYQSPGQISACFCTGYRNNGNSCLDDVIMSSDSKKMAKLMMQGPKVRQDLKGDRAGRLVASAQGGGALSHGEHHLTVFCSNRGSVMQRLA